MTKHWMMTTAVVSAALEASKSLLFLECILCERLNRQAPTLFLKDQIAIQIVEF